MITCSVAPFALSASDDYMGSERPDGLAVKASASRAEDPGFECRKRRE